MLILNCN